MQEASEHGESRDAKADGLRDEIHAKGDRGRSRLMRCARQIRLASSSRVSAPWLLSDAIAGSLGSDTSSSARVFGSVPNSQSERARPPGSARAGLMSKDSANIL
jgi:hypothetical protein